VRRATNLEELSQMTHVKNALVAAAVTAAVVALIFRVGAIKKIVIGS
jgi:hypothetical protein